jgi:hypothetical protein
MAKQISSSGRAVKQMEFGRNDLRVLATIRDCGLISINQLHALFPYRKLPRTDRSHVYHFATRLASMGLIEFKHRIIDGKTGALALTSEGHSRLRLHGYPLEKTNADAEADAAGLPHFVFMNDAMLKFHKAYPVSFWLTDFLVRSENQLREEEGFAKDYDAVFQIMYEKSPLTVAIEYEHTLRNKTRYQEAFKSYDTDPYIQLVIFIVESAEWTAPFTEGMKVPGRRLCYVTSAQFLTQPLSALRVVRWNGERLETITLAQAMQQAATNKNQEYMVSHFPPN